MKQLYAEIIDHYEKCLEKFGDNHLGVDWPKFEDVEKRHGVMLDILKFHNKPDNDKATLLDFGCGTAHLLEYINKNNFDFIRYSGLDISEKFVNVARGKFPDVTFYCGDILDEEFEIADFDYFILNGVFTEKRNLSFDDMWQYFTEMLLRIYAKCRIGFAFNVMSKNVDWERNDLFHVPLDLLSNFLCKNLSRNFVIRNDYGLYEYTVYVFKNI